MRLALTQMNAYAAASSPMFLDHPVANPVQLGCLLCSRPYDRTVDDIQGMDLENLSAKGAFPIERWNSSDADEDGEALPPPLSPIYPTILAPYKLFSLPRASDIPKTRAGLPRFLLIENLKRLMVGAGMKKKSEDEEVAIFLDLLRKFCIQNNCTVLATMGTPKMKKGESYPNVAHWIRGCAEWAEGVDTIIGIEEVRPTTTNGLGTAEAPLYRKLYLKTPGQMMTTRWARFLTAGNLVLTEEPRADVVTGQTVLDQMLTVVEAGRKLTRGDLHGWGKAAEVSARTVDRWIATCLEFGLLKKTGHGMTTVYVKAAAN